MDRKEFWKRFKSGERDFSGVDFKGIRLASLDLTGIILIEASLSGCDLVDTMFHHANLEGTCFQGANLDGANFQHSNLRRANFDSSILIRAFFSECNGDEAVFTNIDDLILTNFYFSSFRKSIWTGTGFHPECVVSDVDFTEAIDCLVDYSSASYVSNVVLPSGEITESLDER